MVNSMRSPTGTFLDDVSLKTAEDELKQVLRCCPKWLLDKLRKSSGEVMRSKYDRSSRRGERMAGDRNVAIPHGLMNEIFSSSEICLGWKVYFLLQFYYCLRPSEVQSLKVERRYWCDVMDSFSVDAVVFYEKKKDKMQAMPLNRRTEKLLRLKAGLDEEGRKYSGAYLNNCFQTIRKRLGGRLSKVVGVTKDGRNKYLYSAHGFRHSATQVFAKEVVDPYKIARFRSDEVRSKKGLGTQSVYRHYGAREWRNDMESAYSVFDEWIEKL